jgi:hypothetical protein
MEPVVPRQESLPSLSEMNRMFGCNVSEEGLDHYEQTMIWGSYGKSGKEKLKYNFLCDLETSHLENILIFCVCPAIYRKVILRLLKKRYLGITKRSNWFTRWIRRICVRITPVSEYEQGALDSTQNNTDTID